MAKLENTEVSPRLAKNLRRNVLERCIEFGLLCSGMFAIFITLAIIYILVFQRLFHSFQHVSLYEFLTDTVWTPNYSIKHYGIMALVSGTLTTTGIALLVAVPLGTKHRYIGIRDCNYIKSGKQLSLF